VSFITRQKPSIGLRWWPQWAGKDPQEGMCDERQ
jgi:hypothetical protein